MQGRKKQSYSEKDLSCCKKGMSVMKRKRDLEVIEYRRIREQSII